MKAIVAALTAGLMILSSAAWAEDFRIATFPKKAGRALIESASDPVKLRRGMQEILPEFKVPARAVLKCRLFDDGIICGALDSIMECPEVIPLEIEGQRNTVEVPVDCVGPDKDGNCECEVAGSK
ncbi:hypothetical protein ATO6_12105 [Oceanicola sp. 22II-s10i]|uniref:hypothetical protein n=1 Tax=Oceanicola sp. 22II-s10i TaxID=1317116 RepID=UPI000B51E94F|nr:hypothetical protein [Oceanicola sp. 22II-s10i]OWU84443.1 hypothetical protein ATO6_12105 [Oceanicola sp. 22II-s10i]